MPPQPQQPQGQPTPPQGMLSHPPMPPAPPMPPHPPAPPMPPQTPPSAPPMMPNSPMTPPMGMPPMPPSAPSLPTEEAAPKPLPEWNRPSNMGNPNDGHKKALLQKLMSNLLSKPGRSMHEIINGVKDAIGAYKNYAKEWDSLNGAVGAGASAAPSMGPSGIQKIMQGIQDKKAPQDGGGGPGMPGGAGPAMPSSMPPAPQMVPQYTGNVPATPSKGIPPLHQLEPMPPIAGPSQQSSFNRPAPVNSLGMFGY